MTIEEINEERFELLHKKCASGLTEEEQVRLDEVMEKMREHSDHFMKRSITHSWPTYIVFRNEEDGLTRL